MKNYYSYLVLIVTLVFCFQLCGISQEKTGSIEGVVKDEIGTPLLEAKVLLKAKEPATKQKSYTTNEEGEFKITDLVPGKYELTCSLEGYSTNKYIGLPVVANKILKINVVLWLATVEETKVFEYKRRVEWAEYYDIEEVTEPHKAKKKDFKPPWPMFHADPQHTGRSPYKGPEKPLLLWEAGAGTHIVSSAAIAADGTIYFGAEFFYAIDPSGEEKWNFVKNGWFDMCTPAIGKDGTIYIGSREKNLYAMNSDGTIKWEFAAEGPIMSSPAIGEDGTIYVGSIDKKLYAINPDGSKKWEFITGAEVVSSPALGKDGTIYVGSHDNNFYAINPDGSKKWEFVTAGRVVSSPAIGKDKTIYVGSDDKNLYAINPDGSKKWEFSVGAEIGCCPAIALDGTIYIGSLDRKVYAIDSTGNKKWQFITAAPIMSSPAIDGNGIIYIGSGDGNLYAINPDGSKKWEFATESGIVSSPAIDADGIIYIGSMDHLLYAIGEAE
jgi:outer membrane protein assembly factor BamB